MMRRVPGDRGPRRRRVALIVLAVCGVVFASCVADDGPAGAGAPGFDDGSEAAGPPGGGDEFNGEPPPGDGSVEDDFGETTDPAAPLCDEWDRRPGELADPVHIRCRIERGSFADPDTPAPGVLRVVDWNIERGQRLDDLLFWFEHDPALAGADVLLLQEVDRLCPRTGSRNQARELAARLGMDYAYGVEFVEVDQGGCEHGNAVLSRFPIVRAAQRRLTNFERWFESGRLGGRMALRVEARVGGRLFQFGTAHLTSGVASYFVAHDTQTAETLELLDRFDGPTVWGGDLNTGLAWAVPFLETSLFRVLGAGYADALAGVPHDRAWTAPPQPPLPPMRLDWIFGRGLAAAAGRVLDDEPLFDLSDHLGIVADFPLERAGR